MKSLMKSVFLLVLAGAALGEVQKRVYVNPNHHNLGGAAPSNQGQHHVILNRLGCAGLVHCGGSLISQDWVITVAHCDCRFLLAVLNAHPTFSKNEVRSVAEKHFCCDNGEDHDLMLLKLRKSKTDQKQPSTYPTIKLPGQKCTAPSPDKEVSFYGWMDARIAQIQGTTWWLLEPFESSQLRYGVTTVTKCDEHGPPNSCQEDLPYTNGQCVCVGRKHVATVAGDSGGSLVWNGLLHGVLKGGPSFLQLDEKIDISHFKDICYNIYRDWIFRVTGL